MIGYPYITQLFYKIIAQSKVLNGRFYVCPKWGSELNNPNIIEALAIGQAQSQKYPAAMLMPPPKTGNFEYSFETLASGNSLYSIYDMKMLFVATTTITGQNQSQQPNGVMESTHIIPYTWHDMDRVAENFMAKLYETLQALGGNVIIWDEYRPRITPITNLGNDGVSGVLLMFKLAVYGGCTIEDYANTPIAPPALTDIHQLHTM